MFVFSRLKIGLWKTSLENITRWTFFRVELVFECEFEISWILETFVLGTTVSKVQCEIIKNNNGIFLKDKSSNGTWVNGHKIGKDAMWPLDHKAEICFAGAKKKVYVFMSTEPQTETFPTVLTNKYTVSKELG